MKLYWEDTLMPRKACAVARYLRLPIDYVHVDLGRGEHLKPEFREINPNAKVPVLIDGERVLWESNAIAWHLAEQAESRLLPRDSQVEVVRWLSWDAWEFGPQAGALYFEHIIKPRYGLGEPDPSAVEQATKNFMRFARVLDQHLTDRRYLLGDTLSIADFIVANPLAYADDAKIPLARFAGIRRWCAQLEELEAWRDPFPER